MRYRPTVHDGVVVVHCHRLDHEDNGMMTSELIVKKG